MAINVNRVTLGFNYRCYETAYFRRLAISCPVSSTALVDGSFLICKAGGLAWFVAPASTEVTSCTPRNPDVSVWGGNLSTCLSNRGYTPTEWFVPDISQLQNPGYCCRTNWGTPTGTYWSSSAVPAGQCPYGYALNFSSGTTLSVYVGGYGFGGKSTAKVRAFRCVTY